MKEPTAEIFTGACEVLVYTADNPTPKTVPRGVSLSNRSSQLFTVTFCL